MSLLDILRGDVPLLKPTRRQLRTIDQEYAQLISRDAPKYITPYSPPYVRECGPLFDDIKFPRDTICQEALDSLNYNANFQADAAMDFVTVLVFATAQGPVADLPVVFKRPHRFFMVTSMTLGSAANTLYAHLVPLGKQPEYNSQGSNAITPDGGEQWFPMNAFGSGVSQEAVGRFVRFEQPVDRFYVDAGRENGGGSPANPMKITFLGTDFIADSTFVRS